MRRLRKTMVLFFVSFFLCGCTSSNDPLYGKWQSIRRIEKGETIKLEFIFDWYMEIFENGTCTWKTDDGEITGTWVESVDEGNIVFDFESERKIDILGRVENNLLVLDYGNTGTYLVYFEK